MGEAFYGSFNHNNDCRRFRNGPQDYKKVLKEIGFTNIIEADDGTSALEEIKKNKVDLILSDRIMPNMDGLELLKTIRDSEEYKDVPFLMVTSEGQKHHVIEAVQEKVSNYIVKPFNHEELKDKILKVLAS